MSRPLRVVELKALSAPLFASLRAALADEGRVALWCSEANIYSCVDLGANGITFTAGRHATARDWALITVSADRLNHVFSYIPGPATVRSAPMRSVGLSRALVQ